MKNITTLKKNIASFIGTSSSPRPLAVFRIGVCLLAITQALILSNNILDLYGSHGLIQWAIGEEIVSQGLPRISWVANFLNPYGISPDVCVYGLFILYVTSLFGLLFGWYSRTMGIIAWLTHFAMTNSGNLTAYGVDTFTHICLFYCSIMPVGASFSIDAWLGKVNSAPSVVANISLKTLQIHLCIVYLSTGLEKAFGIQWWNGEAIWRSVMQPQFIQYNMSWLSSMPWLAMVIGWSVLLIEIGYAIFVWFPKTKTLWVIMTILLHLGIGIFLGLWLFSSIMIVLTFSAFGWTIIERSILCKKMPTFNGLTSKLEPAHSK